MRWLGAALGLMLAGPAWAACGGDPEPQDDCDSDGFTVEADDCNDSNAKVFPGADEICGDDVDNDCDGLTDADCTVIPGDSTLTGGGMCAPKPAAPVAGALPLLLLLRRRRR